MIVHALDNPDVIVTDPRILFDPAVTVGVVPHPLNVGADPPVEPVYPLEETTIVKLDVVMTMEEALTPSVDVMLPLDFKLKNVSKANPVVDPARIDELTAIK